MRHASKLTLFLSTLALSMAAHAELKPQCHSGGGGKGPEMGAGGRGVGSGVAMPSETPVSSTDRSSVPGSVVNPGAPQVILPGNDQVIGSPSDNGTDRIVGSVSEDNGSDTVQSVRLKVQTLRAKLKEQQEKRFASLKNRKKRSGRPNPLDGMIAGNAQSISKTQTISQTAFEEPARAPASVQGGNVSTSYDIQPASVAGSSR